MACRTQWRVGSAGPIGLDYVAVRYMADLADIELTTVVMGKIQALEHHELNRKAS